MRLVIYLLLIASLVSCKHSEARLPSRSECMARMDLNWKIDDIGTRSEYVVRMNQHLNKVYFSKLFDIRGIGYSNPGGDLDEIYYQFPSNCEERYLMLENSFSSFPNPSLYLHDISVPREVFHPGPNTIRTEGIYWID